MSSASPHHLWFAPLTPDTIAVFATAFTLSAKKRGNRVSTERFLAALPDEHKAQMAKLCAAAQNDCNLNVKAADLPAPELPADWQEQICFSTCIESALHQCQPGTDLIAFLHILCGTAVRLHCIVDRNIPIEAYLTRPGEKKSVTSKQTHEPIVIDLDRWQRQPSTSTLLVDEHLVGDVLLMIMAKASGIESLRKCKAVCKSWRQAARHTLCDVGWLREHQIGLHDLLKKGNPSPRLALAMANARPACMHERDGEGLLPLQYAAAYRMDADLVAALRKATTMLVPGGCALGSAEARSIKSLLKPVRTRVSRYGPIAA